MYRAVLTTTILFNACLFGKIAALEVWGDVVWLKSGERREGLVVAHSETSFEISDRIELADRQIEIIAAQEVDTWLQTIDLQRLEKLDPRFPWTYFELADELARFPNDRLAADLMRRLYFICLTLDDRATRQSAKLALKKLLSAEDQKYLEAFEDPDSVDESANIKRPKVVATRDDLDGLQTLLVSIRREDWDQAERLLQVARIRVAQQHWGRIVPWGELVETVTQRRTTDKRLLLLLRLEEAISTAVAPMEIEINPENWLATGWLPIEPETGLSQFSKRFGIDPTANVFRNGSWEHASARKLTPR
ncbi:MAG: hypothetical protein KF851_07430 [Pirellulaceae bacterium]|nr:hypothetical protein [Pirellulaceae bacterium]